VSEPGFRLSGELDLFSVEALRTALGPELHGTVVLDLAAVDFIDDSGLGLMVATIKRLRQQGGTLVVRNPRSHVRRVFEVTGLEKVPGLTIEPRGAAGEGG
jgi:anti-sigma B factor antagonist